MDNKIKICIATDTNYVRHAGALIASILSNAKENDELTFYILNDEINGSEKKLLNELKSIKRCNINFINIKKKNFDSFKNIKTHNYVSLATYYRLKLPSLLPYVDKVIYFDCDFVVNSSLLELYNTDLEGFPIAGVSDVKKKMLKTNPTYVNAGMLIFDLNKMRELKLEDKFLSWTIENFENITCGDQEIINQVCKGQIKLLDPSWNVQSSNFTNRSSYIKNPKGIHFISKKKPWHFASYSYHKDYYFKYLQLTPWAYKGWRKIWWTKVSQIASLISYIGYRPLFLFRPKFYEALFYTYIKPL